MPQNNKLDPQARLDFTWDWGDWIVTGDPIASYTLTAETGLAYEDDNLHASPTTDADDAAVTAWVSVDGGAVGDRLGITCHIVTAAGREDDRTKYFLIIER